MAEHALSMMHVCTVCDDDLVDADQPACMVCAARCRRCGGTACPCAACPVSGWWALNQEMEELCRNPWFARHNPLVAQMPRLYEQT